VSETRKRYAVAKRTTGSAGSAGSAGAAAIVAKAAKAAKAAAMDAAERPVERMLFTAPEVAIALGVSRAHVDRMIQAGKLASVKIGMLRRVTRAQLEAYIAQLERDGAA
jgi:excisionase family DNA binding protein